MRRACVILLASCGFTGPIAKQVDPDANPAANPDAKPDTNPDPDLQAACWTHSSGFTAAACVPALRARIDVTANLSVDTDSTTASPSDVACATLDNATLCALAAGSIHINTGVTLSAHGSRPLALLAHSIDIEGTLDLASHLHGQRGPGAPPGACNGRLDATVAGGGAGGTYSSDGGDGGEQGGATGTAGIHGNSISSTFLRGGCDGGRGGNGMPDGGPPSPDGGPGGGGVWIAVDTGTLTVGPGATVNASGAGGTGGAAGVHGGSGGGSGGLIVLQAPTIVFNPTAKIFANGGHGGGGSQGGSAGSDGTDPPGPTSGGSGGAGGSPSAATPPGGGGAGYPDPSPSGANGDNTTPGGGGGGGGGGPGVILVYSSTSLGGPNVSPPPSN
jgi:hypothetical protein